MRFKERNDLANQCKEWMKNQQNNITIPLDTVHLVLAYLDMNGYLNKVVHCKDCKDAKYIEYAPTECQWYCKNSTNYHNGSFFCSLGEGEEDDN